MYRDPIDDRISLLGWVAAIATACLVFLGVTLPGGSLTLTSGQGSGQPGQVAHATSRGYGDLVRPATPTRLEVPSLGIAAGVLPVGLGPDRVLNPPRDPHRVGWWTGSARPGTSDGRTLITGHTVHTGGGAMDHLGDVRPGAQVRVETSAGPMVYRVTRVRTLTKQQVAAQQVALFGQRGHAGDLLLVTCSGWTGDGYTSNVFVDATALGTPI